MERKCLLKLLIVQQETDIALDLYKDDMDRPDFEILAEKIELMTKRAQHIVDTILGQQNKGLAMAYSSFLSDQAKEKFIKSYKDKVKRFS